MKLFGLALVVGALGSMTTLAGCGDSASDGTGGGGGSSSPSSSSSGGGDGGAGVTTTTTTTTTSTTTSTGSGMIQCNEPYTDVPTGECDLLQQDCPQANQNCAFVDDGNGGLTTACVLANGLKGLAQSCQAQSECAAGLFCIGNECTPACCPENDEPCGGGLCNVSINIGDSGKYFYGCSFGDQCMLFDAAACPGEQCNIVSDGFAICGSNSGDMAEPGDPCEFVNDCGSMQVCLSGQNPADPGVCRWLCQGGSNAQPGLGGCPTNHTCNLNIDLGFTNVGFCDPL